LEFGHPLAYQTVGCVMLENKGLIKHVPPQTLGETAFAIAMRGSDQVLFVQEKSGD